MTGLRPYQVEAVRAAVARLREDRSTLVVMPTGTGKTQVFVALAGLARGRVLVLAHRDELVAQAAARVKQLLGCAPGIEKAEHRADRDARVVIASVQTLRGPRLEAWPAEHFGLVVVDEAHHAAATTYRAVLGHFAGTKVVGVTATPDRADAKALGAVFESVAFNYELPDAVADGWLVRPALRRVVLEHVDLRAVTVARGDLVVGELEDQLGADDVLDAIADALLEYTGDRKTLVYTPGVTSAHRLAEKLSERAPGLAAAVDGETPTDKRRALLRAHERGDFRILANCQVLTEGYDSPSVSCIAVARPTRSRALYAQMVGRGLRPAEGKADCLVLDFAGATRRLDLVGPEDVLAGSDEGAVAGEAKEREGDGPVDVLGLLEQTRRDIAYRLEEAQRTARAARAPRKGAVAAALAWTLFGLRPRDWSAQTEYGGRPATAAQLRALERFGMDVGAELTRAAASTLLDTAITRARDGRATLKQLRWLVQLGAGDADTTFGEARAALDRAFGGRAA